MEFASEIVSRRVDPRLRTSDAYDVSDDHKQYGNPVKTLRGKIIAFDYGVWMRGEHPK